MAWSLAAVSVILDGLLIGFIMYDSAAEGR